MRLTNNADPKYYGYTGYDIRLNACSHFYRQTVAGIKMLFLELIIVALCMSITKRKIS